MPAVWIVKKRDDIFMRTIISPAKNMKQKDAAADRLAQETITRPAYTDASGPILAVMKAWQPWDFESSFGLNEKLALQAFLDYQALSLREPGEAALFFYDGLVFKHIEPEVFSEEELRFANANLRILSAFYGILKPLDGICHYRLDMLNKVRVEGKSLYRYWGRKLYDSLFAGEDTVINLASEEYAKTIRRYLQPGDKFIDIVFLNWHRGKLRTTVTPAKMARGRMVQYLVKNQIQKPEQLKDFNWNGYQFQPEMSDPEKYVFVMT